MSIRLASDRFKGFKVGKQYYKTGRDTRYMDLYCWTCGDVVKGKIEPQTKRVMCPKCHSIRVYTCPNPVKSNQVAHFVNLMRKIRESIVFQYKKKSVGSERYIEKDEWMKMLYGPNPLYDSQI